MAGDDRSPTNIAFGDYRLSLSSFELRKHGLKVRLRQQPARVLAALAGKSGDIVTREELQQELWKDHTFVDFESGLNNCIKQIRAALNDDLGDPKYVETIPRVGYRFLVPLEEETSEPPRGHRLLAPAESSVAREPGPNLISVAAPESTTVPANPQGIPRPPGKKAKIVVLAAMAAIAILVALSFRDLREQLVRWRNPRIQSLAVLPMANLSGDTDQDYFAEGMTEALITDLGKIGALRVISRTSVTPYKATNKPLTEIARQLNVDAILEGTVSRTGNHLRITANLIQASPEKHLWAQTYNSDTRDVLALQGEVAQEVADEIQIKMTPQERKLLGHSQPVNPKAHDDYLKGRYLCRMPTPRALGKGVQFFQQAIAEAPENSLAYAGLANCYAFWGWLGDVYAGDPAPRELMSKARDAALKALQLDENLAEAHNALAAVKLILDWDWPGAEQEVKRAIALNPSYSSAHMLNAHYLVATSRFEEAITEAKRSLELDPFDKMALTEWIFYLSRHYDFTIQQAETSLEFAPEFSWAHYDIAQVYERAGRDRDAIEEYIKAEKLFGMSEDKVAALQKAYRESGEKGYWRKTLAFCQEGSRRPRTLDGPSRDGWCDYATHADLAALHVRLGELDATFRLLEKALEDRDSVMLYLNVDPHWDSIRSNPRFRDFVLRVGLPQ